MDPIIISDLRSRPNSILKFKYYKHRKLITIINGFPKISLGKSLPFEIKGSVAETVTKREHRSIIVELVSAARILTHGHVSERYHVNITTRILGGGGGREREREERRGEGREGERKGGREGRKEGGGRRRERGKSVVEKNFNQS